MALGFQCCAVRCLVSGNLSSRIIQYRKKTKFENNLMKTNSLSSIRLIGNDKDAHTHCYNQSGCTVSMNRQMTDRMDA